MFKVAILTISDRGSKGEREDSSGPLIQEMVKGLPAQVIHYEIIPDEKEVIIEALKKSADQLKADLILTTGGTGLSPRDVTPDATLKVIDKEIPGFSEAMRAESLKKTLTYDRGKEMADHKKFTISTKMQVFFCDPNSPWQRGTNENTNGLIRGFFPKGTDFNEITNQKIRWVQEALNERPRETLDFKTPKEAMNLLLLHQ